MRRLLISVCGLALACSAVAGLAGERASADGLGVGVAVDGFGSWSMSGTAGLRGSVLLGDTLGSGSLVLSPDVTAPLALDSLLTKRLVAGALAGSDTALLGGMGLRSLGVRGLLGGAGLLSGGVEAVFLAYGFYQVYGAITAAKVDAVPEPPSSAPPRTGVRYERGKPVLALGAAATDPGGALPNAELSDLVGTRIDEAASAVSRGVDGVVADARVLRRLGGLTAPDTAAGTLGASRSCTGGNPAACAVVEDGIAKISGAGIGGGGSGGGGAGGLPRRFQFTRAELVERLDAKLAGLVNRALELEPVYHDVSEALMETTSPATVDSAANPRVLDQATGDEVGGVFHDPWISDVVHWARFSWLLLGSEPGPAALDLRRAVAGDRELVAVLRRYTLPEAGLTRAEITGRARAVRERSRAGLQPEVGSVVSLYGQLSPVAEAKFVVAHNLFAGLGGTLTGLREQLAEIENYDLVAVDLDDALGQAAQLWSEEHEQDIERLRRVAAFFQPEMSKPIEMRLRLTTSTLPKRGMFVPLGLQGSFLPQIAVRQLTVAVPLGTVDYSDVCDYFGRDCDLPIEQGADTGLFKFRGNIFALATLEQARQATFGDDSWLGVFEALQSAATRLRYVELRTVGFNVGDW